MRTLLILLLLFSGSGVSIAQDTLTLKSGGELRGEIVQETETRYTLRCNGGTIQVLKERVVKVEHEGRVEADYLKTLHPGSLPRIDDLVRAMGKQEFLKDLHQIPATVIDIGEMRDVPYQSFKAGDYEINVYGDPEDPAGIEIGMYPPSLKLNQPKENCVRFVEDNVLVDAADKLTIENFRMLKNSAVHGTLTLEISPETDADSYGGWWVDIFDKAKLEKARVSVAEKESMTVKAADVSDATQSGDSEADLSTWNRSDLSDSRRSSSTHASSTASGGGSGSGGSVYVRGYTRKDGTYVQAHTRSSPRRR